MGLLWRSGIVLLVLLVLVVPVISQAGPFGIVELLLLPVLALGIGFVWRRAELRADVRRSARYFRNPAERYN